MSHKRLDPSEITPEPLEHLSGVLTAPGRAALVDEAGNRVELPGALFQHLLRIVRLVSERRAIVMIPEDETFTTQAAANYLGMARQHLVNLLEEGRIPFHRVGSHRRVYFRDLLAFGKKRDADRRDALDRLMHEVDEAGLYDSPTSAIPGRRCKPISRFSLMPVYSPTSRRATCC